MTMAEKGEGGAVDVGGNQDPSGRLRIRGGGRILITLFGTMVTMGIDTEMAKAVSPGRAAASLWEGSTLRKR